MPVIGLLSFATGRSLARSCFGGSQVPRESVESQRTGGLGLFLFAAPAVVESSVAALAAAMFAEIAGSSPLDRIGTIAVGVAAAVLSAFGAVLAFRRAVGALATVVALGLGVVGGLLALIAFAFLFAGGASLIFGVLLVHAVFSIAMIVRAATHSRAEGATS
jgi:hypothetical protein